MFARNIYRRYNLDVHRMRGSAAADRHRILDVKRMMAGLIFVHDFREGSYRRRSLSRMDRRDASSPFTEAQLRTRRQQEFGIDQDVAFLNIPVRMRQKF